MKLRIYRCYEYPHHGALSSLYGSWIEVKPSHLNDQNSRKNTAHQHLINIWENFHISVSDCGPPHETPARANTRISACVRVTVCHKWGYEVDNVTGLQSTVLSSFYTVITCMKISLCSLVKFMHNYLHNYSSHHSAVMILSRSPRLSFSLSFASFSRAVL